MSSQIFSLTTGQMVVVVAVLGVAVGLKALASVLRTWIEESSRTRRLDKALAGSRPNQRPGIIRACGQLEGSVATRPDVVSIHEALQADNAAQPQGLAPQNDGGHKYDRTDDA